MKNQNAQENSLDWILLAIGFFSFIAFLTVFVNIPWEWSMFMDDTLYNAWMPKTTSLWESMRDEVMQYWSLGRFYPVKYLANLLKWRYLPNDPNAFRYFNFFIFLNAVFFLVAGAIRATGEKLELSKLPILLFLAGAAFLHKPIMEIISLNPLGETWVCFFYALGVFCFFSSCGFSRHFLSKIFFLLAALAKEPAALIFFASATYYLFLFFTKNEKRKTYAAEAIINALIFAGLLLVAIIALRTGSFTKGAYFGTTPWMRYLYDFTYKLIRYGLWTSPFLLFFFLAKGKIFEILKQRESNTLAGAIFFLSFALPYLVFMSVQGRIAYQEVPGSIALLGLFSLLTASIYFHGEMLAIIKKYGLIILLLYGISFFISVSRWQRYVRGIVEPRRAVENVLKTNEGVTILIPVGEIYGHIQKLLADSASKSQVFQIDENLKPEKLKGKLIVFQFPIYMGDPNPQELKKLEDWAGGWEATSITQSYHIYVGKKIFPETGK